MLDIPGKCLLDKTVHENILSDHLDFVTIN